MTKDFSFDIVSDYDIGEMNNAVDQAQRELATRYDFRNSDVKLDFISGAKEGIIIEASSQNQLRAVLDVFQTKLIKRQISLKVLDLSSEPIQNGMNLKWIVKFNKGLNQEQAKQITKTIQATNIKVKTSIQGDNIRVSSLNKDDLQKVISILRTNNFDFPISFINYR